jgi:1-acyl-sn-glycerol-3-phosphate acyltransferase
MKLSGQEYVDMYATRAKEEAKRLEREAKERAKESKDAKDAEAADEPTEHKRAS